MPVKSVPKTYLRKAIKVGNSAGVLLPRALLGADVKVIVVNRPINIKKDTIKILTPIFEDILGVYLIKQEERQIEILAVTTKVNKHLEKGVYSIDITPLDILKKSIKTKKETKQKIHSAKVIINKRLLTELKK